MDIRFTGDWCTYIEDHIDVFFLSSRKSENIGDDAISESGSVGDYPQSPV